MNLLDKYRMPNWAPEDGGGGGAGPSPPEPSSAPSSSGPASAPAAQTIPAAAGAPPPSAPTAAPSEPSGGGDSMDFSAIFDGPPSDSGVIEVPVTPAGQSAAQPQEPQEPPKAAPAQAPQATPQAVTPQASQPGTATPPAQAQPALDRYDPAMLAQHLASNEELALTYVAENVFRMTPAEVEALETNVVEAIPKLLAKVFVKSQQNVLSQLANMVPVMIQRQNAAMQKNAVGEDKFYQRWPNIAKAQHGELVNKYGAVYRQMHPNATLEQMVEDLGPMIMMAARIAPQATAPAPGVPANPLAAPRAAGASNGRAPPPSPFVPGGSMGPAGSVNTPELAPWEAMFREQ